MMEQRKLRKDTPDIVTNVRLDSAEVLLRYVAVMLNGSGCWTESELGNLPSEVERFRSRNFRQTCYREFSIPKRNGGVRMISAPHPRLKSLQKAIADILTNRFFISSSAHGFAPGRSVLTNAQNHVGKNYVFNTDISGFFSSITGHQVMTALRRCGIPDDTAHIIKDICCYMSGQDGDLPAEVLPQGAPSSPFLSNMVCAGMDRKLEGLARRFGLDYSRYADDITFSSNRNVYAEGSEFRKELQRIISGYGFVLNMEKTRLQKRGQRQEVTGLTVCDKVNVGRRYIKTLRAQIFDMEMNGFDDEGYRSARGKVEFLGMVRGKDDPLYQKLAKRVKDISGRKNGLPGRTCGI